MSGIDKFLSVLSLATFPAGVAGIVFFYCGVTSVTCGIAVFLLVESFLQVIFGEQNGFFTQILAAITGLVIALIAKADIISNIGVALCYEATLIGFFTFPSVLAALKASSRKYW